MKEWTVEFNMNDEDTCKKRWIFRMKEDGEKTVIDSVTIDQAERGCIGHPKTIMALIRNVPVDQIDTDALAHASCARGTSCGMVLSSCIRSIRESI